jgi:hypothetical protein
VFVDPELRSFAQTEGSPKRSVILETITNPVSAPARLKSTSERSQKGSSSSRPVDEAASFKALANELERLDLADAPVRLEGIRSFVVELTPEQLRRVLELPMVGAIRLNRTHRTPRSVDA